MENNKKKEIREQDSFTGFHLYIVINNVFFATSIEDTIYVKHSIIP